MMFIVDGTGEEWFLADDAGYNKAMENGFCKRVEYQLGSKARYWRGPTLTGRETGGIAAEVADAVQRVSEAEPVYLAGHSRGGAAVIVAAQRVRRKIAAMFLFDAVDRTVDLDCATISGNVQNVYHAMRNPEFAKRFETERDRAILETAKNLVLPTTLGGFPTLISALKLSHVAAQDFKQKVLRFRTVFGNAGTSVQPPGRYFREKFMCTHGAVGGVPWPDVAGDADESKQIWTWMAARMQGEGMYQIHGV